jgi:hypothetical protein
MYKCLGNLYTFVIKPAMRAIFTLYLSILVISASAQINFVASQNGNWNLGTTWGGACASGCTAGVDYPGINDNAYTNGFIITVNGGFSCHNLFLEYNVANGLSFSGSTRLTIDGSLLVWDSGSAWLAEPTADIVENEGAIRFSGGNVDFWSPYLIMSWDHSVADFGFLQFDLGTGNTYNFQETIKIGQFGTSARELRVLSGTLKADPAAEIHGLSNSSVVVNSSAFLETDDPISGGSSASKIGTVSISGTLTTSSYINSTNLNIGSSGVLNTFYTGADQTEGWWFQSNRPTAGTVNSAGTVSFKASAAQNFYARDYGNLTFEGSGNKTLVGANTLNVAGALTINTSTITLNTDAATVVNIGGNVTNSGSWTPADQVTFNGSGSQAIGGVNAITFTGGLVVSKSAGTLTLNRGVTISNGLTINAGTLNLGSQTVTLSSGNLDNGGTLTASSSTLVISGTSSVAGSSTTSLYNLTINSGGNLSASNNMAVGGTLTNNGTLNVSSGGNLNVNGNLANSGTFNANNGTVTFGGSSTQTISGSSALAFTNMTVNNTLNNNGIVNISGAFSMNETAIFDADGAGSGSFTIKSSGLTGGGRIAALTAPGNFNGNVHIERFIDGPADWRYLSMPLTATTSGGSPNVGQWKAHFPVTGEFSDPSPTGSNGVTCSDPASVSCASIYLYNATSQSYIDVGTGGSVAATALDYRTGYSAYTYLSGNFTLSVSGAPVKGSVSVPLKTSWNLVPNPYPSAIDWDNITTTGTTNTIYFTTGQGSYATYLKGSPCTGCSFNTAWTGEVAIGQSFWIESTGATSLPLEEASKTSNNATFVRSAAHRDYFRVTLKSGSKEDDMIVRFAEGATADLEYTLDAKKRKHSNFINLSSYNSDASVDYAINTIPFISCTAAVKLTLTNVSAGSHVLRFTELETLTAGYDISLVDKFANSETTISSGLEYTFEVTADAASFGADRFEIKIVSPSVDLTRDLDLSSTLECTNQYVRLDINNSQEGIEYVFKAGDTALNAAVTGNGQNSFALVDKSLLEFGLNKLDLVAASLDGCNAHIFNEAITVQFDAIDEITTVTSAQSCGEGSVTLEASGASAGGFYRWYESVDAFEAIAGANDATFVTPSLSETRSYYVAAVNANGCESTLRVPVEAKVVINPTPEISIEGDKFIVNAKSGIQWYKDGEAIDGATLGEYEPKNTGTYSASVMKDGCVTHSDTFEFIVNSEGGKSNPSGYTLSPNPTSGIMYVNGPSFRGVAVTIYDSKGRALNIAGKPVNENQQAFDLSTARNGLYFINILSQRKLVQLKAIKK